MALEKVKEAVDMDSKNSYLQEQQLYREAISLCASMPEASYNLAVSLLSQPQPKFEEAIKYMKESTEKSEDSIYKIGLGVALAEAGRIEDAGTIFEALIAKDGNNSIARRTLASLYLKRGDEDRAISLLRGGKKTVEEYLDLSVIFLKRKDYQAVKEILEEIPDGELLEKALVIKGLSSFFIGDEAEAIKLFERALQSDDGSIEKEKSADLFRAYAVLLKKNGNFSEAASVLKKIIAQGNNNSEIMFEYAEALALADDFSKSEEVLLKVLTLNQKSAKAYSIFGWLLVKQGRFEDAIQYLEQALSLDNKDTAARTNLGVCYGRIGKSEEAKREFTEALRVKPDYLPARKNLEKLMG